MPLPTEYRPSYVSPGAFTGAGGLGAPAYNPAAFGRIPQYPATTTDTTAGTTSRTGGWQTGLYNYPALNQQAAELAAEHMGGNVSLGTTNLLNRLAAERGVGFGPMAPVTSAGFLAATGKLSEAESAQGMQEYLALLGATPRTTTETGTTTGSATTDQGIRLAEAAAMPDPYAAAMANMAAQQAGLSAGRGSVGGGAPVMPAVSAPNVGGIPSYSSQFYPSSGAENDPSVAYSNWNRMYGNAGDTEGWSADLGAEIMGNLNQPASSVFGEATGGYDVFNPAGFALGGYGEMPDYSGAGTSYPAGAPTMEAAAQFSDPWAEAQQYMGAGGDWTDPGYGYEDLLSEPGTGDEWWNW